MQLVNSLSNYIQQNGYTLAHPLSTGVIALFKPVEQGTNIHPEYQASVWQINYAWLNTLAINKWSVLSPVWMHPLDCYTLNLREVARPITPEFLEELDTKPIRVIM